MILSTSCSGDTTIGDFPIFIRGFPQRFVPAPSEPTPRDQVKKDFVDISQKQCGAPHVFIGETGFNTGCPGVYGTQYVADATTFVTGVTQWACEQSLGLFHFAYVDACPAGGCLAGCAAKAPATLPSICRLLGGLVGGVP